MRFWTGEVTAVRVERLQEISDEDALAEGIDVPKNLTEAFLGLHQRQDVSMGLGNRISENQTMRLTRTLTMRQEAEIRRQFFVDKLPPETICAQWKIREARLRILVGGPLRRKETAIEKVYS